MSGALCKRWSALGCLVVLVMSAAMVGEARAQTGDDLYKKAAQEGIVNFYGTLAQINAEKILRFFEKRYPGVSGRAQQLVDAIQNIGQIRDTGELEQLLTTDSNGIWRTLKTILSRFSCSGIICSDADIGMTKEEQKNG